MTEIQKRILADFGVPLSIEKHKAGFAMCQAYIDGQPYGYADLVGPEFGHSCPSPCNGFSLDGWAYVLTQDGWRLERDGIFAWRSKERSNPFPEVPAL